MSEKTHQYNPRVIVTRLENTRKYNPRVILKRLENTREYNPRVILKKIDASKQFKSIIQTRSKRKRDENILPHVNTPPRTTRQRKKNAPIVTVATTATEKPKASKRKREPVALDKINFELGEIIVAKVRGYQAWPARIESMDKKIMLYYFGSRN